MAMSDEHNPNIDSYQEYRRRIELKVDGIEEELEHYDELHQAVFESVDGSRMVIYTHEAINVLKHSQTQPGEWKHLVGEDDSWQKIIQALAFDIVRQDVWKAIRDRGLDDE